jgi:hypothetical protein
MFVRLIGAAFCLGAMLTAALAQSPDLATLARASGTPEIPGLKIIWLSPWGDVAKANPWRNIIVHQTEGPAGSARAGALAQAKNPTRPTHGDGANRNDNKYIDNRATFRQVLKDNSIGVEFSGNFPDVARPATAEQIAAWRILVRVLQARYGIADERIYAHNWIDRKDARYCEGCDLATLARGAAFSTKPAR